MTSGDETASFTLEYFDSTDLSGDPVHVEPARLSRVMWLGQPHEDLTVGSYSIRLSGTFTPDLSGPWRLGLESAGRSVLRLDGAIVVDNSEPAPRRQASTVREARWYRSSAPSNAVGPMLCRSTSGPARRQRPHGRAHRRRPPRRQRRVRACGGGRPSRRCCRRGGRFQQPVGVRGAGPAGSLPARTPARTGRSCDRGESTNRGRGERGLPRRDALGGSCRRRPSPLVRRRRSSRRPGRHHRGGGRAERPAARSPSRHGRRTGRPGACGALSGGRRAGDL